MKLKTVATLKVGNDNNNYITKLFDPNEVLTLFQKRFNPTWKALSENLLFKTAFLHFWRIYNRYDSNGTNHDAIGNDIPLSVLNPIYCMYISTPFLRLVIQRKLNPNHALKKSPKIPPNALTLIPEYLHVGRDSGGIEPKGK